MKYIVVTIGQCIVFFLNCVMHFFGYILVFIWDLKIISFKKYLEIWVSNDYSGHKGELQKQTYAQIFKRWFDFDYYS